MNLLSRFIQLLTAKKSATVDVAVAAATEQKRTADIKASEVEEIYKPISEDKIEVEQRQVALSLPKVNQTGNVDCFTTTTTTKSSPSLSAALAPTTKQSIDKKAVGEETETEAEAAAAVREDSVVVTMVQEQNNVHHDGADEQMLGTEDKDKLAERRDEVKFIKGDHQNGDAKIDIGNVNARAFTGMTKEELMKYANDPFWVRLRWIFFIAFWLVWVGMLVGALLIIIDAPKCAAPEPLTWYKRGLHAKFGNVDEATPDDVKATKKLEASGAIYELPSTLTYKVKEPEVEARIKRLVDQYKGTDVNVVLDLTPNYVDSKSQLFIDAQQNESKRSAFVWHDGQETLPTNWLKIGGNRTAWTKVGSDYVLSQFGDETYDLRMNDTHVKQEFTEVLKHLLDLGIKGFRLKNTKFYLISPNLEDEEHSTNPKDMGVGLEEYGFYNHYQTTFQEKLGDLLYEYVNVVKNISSDAFLSVADDIIRPESYQTSSSGNVLGIDLPMYGKFVQTLSSRHDLKLQRDLEDSVTKCGNHSWVQWDLATVYHDTPANPSAIALFISLLPGVPVVPVDSVTYENVTEKTYRHIHELRQSQSYMFGVLDVYDAPSVIAYSRIKSGNPGYFVVFNPTAHAQTGNFTNLLGLPTKMTVDYLSDNFNSSSAIKPKVKVDLPTLELEPYSTVILTYVPDKSD